MSPIARALRLQTQAERHDTTMYVSSFPTVARIYAYLMMSIGVRLACGVAPIKGGAA